MKTPVLHLFLSENSLYERHLWPENEGKVSGHFSAFLYMPETL